MNMKIDRSLIKAVFEFTAAEYFLVYAKDDRFSNATEGGKPLMVWTLNPRIDRSYKGKIDDCGMPVIYLEEAEAKKLQAGGFTTLVEETWVH